MKKRKGLSWFYVRWSKDEGFSLIELVVSLTLFFFVVTSLMHCVVMYFQVWEHLVSRIDVSENTLTATHTLFQLIRYSKTVQILNHGKRLRLSLGENSIDIYLSGEDLLLLNRGVANPLVEKCRELHFCLDPSLSSQELVSTQFTIDAPQEDEKISLHIRPSFWK